MKSCCFGFRAVALLLMAAMLNYSESTSLVIPDVLEGAISLLVSFYSSLPSKCSFLSLNIPQMLEMKPFPPAFAFF